MRTSEQWWNETKSDPEKLIQWLRKQYHGEVTASARIKKYALTSCTDEALKGTLELIAAQELQHAAWVGSLLQSRGINPQVLEKTDRYWDETLKDIRSFETATAVAAHAEAMRLERIRVIANDEEAPTDIRRIFSRILVDEEFHERAFRQMAGQEAMSQTMMSAQRGRAAIGLINQAEVI